MANSNVQSLAKISSCTADGLKHFQGCDLAPVASGRLLVLSGQRPVRNWNASSELAQFRLVPGPSKSCPRLAAKKKGIVTLDGTVQSLAAETVDGGDIIFQHSPPVHPLDRAAVKKPRTRSNKIIRRSSTLGASRASMMSGAYALSYARVI